MKKLTIIPGAEVVYNQKRYIITHLLDLKRVLAQQTESREVDTLDIAKIEPYIEETNAETNKQNHIIELVSDKEWQTAQQRFAIIRPLISARNGQMVAQAAKEHNVNRATLYRWISRYMATGMITSLVPQKKGGYGQKRLKPEVEAILDSAIEDEYLTPQRKTIAQVYRKVQERCKAANLTPPHEETLRRRISQLSQYSRLKNRYSKKTADQLTRPKVEKYKEAKFPLHVVQIDHTQLDVEVVDVEDRESMGRPWFTVAIDVFSRVVLGFYLYMEKPSIMSVGMCLSHAILPKEEWLAKINGAGEWPCWGVMRVLHSDNGKEFHSKALRMACQQYNIESQFRIVKQPEWGGHIERLMDTFNEEIHSLPGTTFSNIQEKKEYDAAKNAVFTLDELEAWLTNFIVNVYHCRLHQGIGTSPIARYKEGIFADGKEKSTGLPPRFTDTRKVRLDFMPHTERTIQQYGVKINHIHYYDHILQPWINYVDPSSGKAQLKQKFIFKMDPKDISEVYFLDPELKEYYPIPYRDISHPPMSIWEYKEIRKRLRQQGVAQIDEETIFKGYEMMHSLEEQAKKATRASRRKKAIQSKSEELKTMLHRPVENYHSETDSMAYEDDIQPFEEVEHDTFRQQNRSDRP